MDEITLPELTLGAAIQLSDIFITRQGSDTEDTSITASQMLDFIEGLIVVPAPDAADVAVDDTAHIVLTSSDTQSAFDGLDRLLKYGNFYQPLGWTIMTEDFTRGSVIADYLLTNQSSGSSAAATVLGTGMSTRMLGYLNLTTGTTSTGAASAATGVFMDATRLVAGDQIYAMAGGIWFGNAPTIAEDYAAIAAWINQSGSATYVDTTTTAFHCYYKAQRTETNWKFYYVDNSSVLQSVDTGLAYAADGYPTFETLMTIGATAAQTTLAWRATSKAGVVTSGTVTGVRAFNGDTLRVTVGRIYKSAGATARIMAVDSMGLCIKTARRYV